MGDNKLLWNWIDKYNEISGKYGAELSKNKMAQKQILLCEQEILDIKNENIKLKSKCDQLQKQYDASKITESDNSWEKIYTELNIKNTILKEELQKTNTKLSETQMQLDFATKQVSFYSTKYIELDQENKKLTSQQQKVNVEELQKQIEALTKEVRSIQEFI